MKSGYETKLADLTHSFKEKCEALDSKNFEIEQLNLKNADLSAIIDTLETTVEDLTARNKEIQLAMRESQQRIRDFEATVENVNRKSEIVSIFFC